MIVEDGIPRFIVSMFKTRRSAYILERLPKVHPKWQKDYPVTGEHFQAHLSDAVAMIFSLGWEMKLYLKWVAISDLYCITVDGWFCELERARWGLFPDGTSAEATFTAGGWDVDPMRAIMKALREAEKLSKTEDFERLYMDV